ncbi:gamma-glutamyl-gamma-aminobutyrate hydrolase family protein [Rapidithrix thailandica]|uniref:Gamma-glutamyl-gamma-aminobutyrate hydrolase family protein n=1 Tax=Rapidithrix thailandica TaxID=413964 RepID=A0AAW9S2Z2_9BACT
MIKIGVSSCLMYPDVERTVFGPKHLCYLERDMARYLAREEVMPWLIPDLEGKALENFLSEMDGFVFQGGSDLAPQTYGEAPILNGRWKGDAYRDTYELKIMEYAMKHEKPIFGICRGFQLMNVFFGGCLYQDIATQAPEARQHRDAIQYDQVHHEVALVKDKLLSSLYPGKEKAMVNSVHHQAVKSLGKDLDVLAYSLPDQLVEAFCWTGAQEGKVLGVQWHPEFTPNSTTPLLDENVLYKHFLSHCGM